jgi:hypothetical protein
LPQLPPFKRPSFRPATLKRIWSKPTSLTSVRTQRGLLIAGVLTFVILVGGLLVRATPTHRESDLGEQAAERDEPAGSSVPAGSQTITTSAESGASSREGAESTTTVAPYVGATHEVANAQQWAAAVAAAEPGDTIKLVATINQILQYRGSRAEPGEQEGADGTADRPITITAAEGVWIDPGDQNNRKPALDILYTSHVNVVGVNVRNSQFGIRVLYSTGTATSPVMVSGNVVQDIGHAGIHIAGHLESHEPSQHVRVEGNVVARTGRTSDTFGEGIYLGFGSQEWVDETSDIAVIGNDISGTTGEAIDIKPGTKRVLVEGNLIHDLSPKDGGAISAHYVNTTGNPNPDEADNVVIRRNRIWNVNLEARAGANNWAIWVGHGGVTIEGNAIWGMQAQPNTIAVRIRALQNFGPHPIRIVNNVFWTTNGWSAIGEPSGAGNVAASGNRGPSGASGVEVPLSPGGAVPAVGSGGTADAGGGPGSAFGPWDTQATIWLAS